MRYGDIKTISRIYKLQPLRCNNVRPREFVMVMVHLLCVVYPAPKLMEYSANMFVAKSEESS